MKTWNYNTEIYNFKKIVQQYLDYDDLDGIHADLAFDKKLTNISGEAPDQKTKIHKMFYSNMDSNPIFKETYDSFIKEVVPEIVGTDDFLYQKFPTFRVHQPENIAVFAYHKDKEYNHSPKEINLFLPITRAFDTNTVWVESEEDKADYSPINCDYGQVISWDGANLRHGNKDNDTGFTRMSFDFRILKREDYDANQIKESVSNSKKFIEGDYFVSNRENYFDESNGHWCKEKYDAEGNEIYFEDTDEEDQKAYYEGKKFDIDPELQKKMKEVFGDLKDHKFADFSQPKTLDPKELEDKMEEFIMKRFLKKKS